MGETAGGVLRRGRDRLIGGVCSGLAAAWHLDPLLVRVVAVVLLFVPPVGPLVALLYIVLWLAMPPAEGWEGSGPSLDTRVRMATDELRQDFRSMFHRADGPPPETGSAAGEPAPPTDTGAPSSSPPKAPGSTAQPTGGSTSGWGWAPRRHTGGLWFGGILILLGLYLLGENLGILTAFRWDLFWPVVIIVLGVLILARRVR